MSGSRVVVFGREPRPGRVKTRLARTVGDDAAAAVYAGLLEHTLSQAMASGHPVVLMLAQQATSGWQPPFPVPIETQCEGDLGQRMHGALQRHFQAGHSRAVIVGSDCPELHADHLVDALAALDRQPVVLGPASDGGYWLVAQRSPGLDMFSGIRWSSPSTLGMTRERLSRAGVGWHELEVLCDVDTEQDLREVLDRARTDRAMAGLLRSWLRAT